jgi:diguanylate cyclase (GGDEF)-like protein
MRQQVTVFYKAQMTMNTSHPFFPKVSDIAHMGVVVASGEITIAEAVDLMGHNQLSNIIYENEQGHGLFTVEDLLQFRRSNGDFSARLNQLAFQQLRYIRAEDDVLGVLSILDEIQSRYLGVQDNTGRLCGIVSYADVLISVDPSFVIDRRTIGEFIHLGQAPIVSPTTKTEDVLLQIAHAEDALLIGDKDGLAGILTAKDAIRIIRDESDTSAPVSRYMTTPVSTMDHNATVREALEYLQKNKFKRAIVVDKDNHLVGVVTQKDLISFAYGRWTELLKLHASQLSELVGKLEERNARLEHDSLTDTLTGIGNRRKINQAIEAEIGRYYRHKSSPFSIMFLDIDFFKKINDVHGHMAGDEILKFLCAEVDSELRVTDVLARWGGEEFLILLPATGINAAQGLAERIRKKIADTACSGIQFTISIGVGEYSSNESIDDLIQRVDSALYAAKDAGRNCVKLAL